MYGPKTAEIMTLSDYADGVADTLDGSSGATFTYLPIVFEGDCQIVTAKWKWLGGAVHRYRVKVTFLGSDKEPAIHSLHRTRNSRVVARR
jgi:hypothetical protein